MRFYRYALKFTRIIVEVLIPDSRIALIPLVIPFDSGAIDVIRNNVRSLAMKTVLCRDIDSLWPQGVRNSLEISYRLKSEIFNSLYDIPYIYGYKSVNSAYGYS